MSTLLVLLVLLVSRRGLAAPDAPLTGQPAAHGPSSPRFPSHHFQVAGHSAHDFQVGVNFGLLQLELGGLNVSIELRYRRLWVAYQHGVSLTLNNLDAVGLSAVGMTQDERADRVHLYVPYSTGFGAGVTLIDELWAGVELTTTRFQVNAPGGAPSSYQTYSVGVMLGYRFFIWRGFSLNAYVHYWPNVASTLHAGQVVLAGENGNVTHHAHAFNFYPNLALAWSFDM